VKYIYLKNVYITGFFRGKVFSPHPLTDKFSSDLLPLLSVATEDAKLLSRVEELAAEHGNSVYKEMLLMMTGKHFGTELSKRYCRTSTHP
jgi:hypothetical protein